MGELGRDWLRGVGVTVPVTGGGGNNQVELTRTCARSLCTTACRCGGPPGGRPVLLRLRHHRGLLRRQLVRGCGDRSVWPHEGGVRGLRTVDEGPAAVVRAMAQLRVKHGPPLLLLLLLFVVGSLIVLYEPLIHK